MTTIDTSASTSAQDYHDSLVKATNAVINASRTVKKQIADPKKVVLTTRITFLDGMEKAVLKQVQDTSATPTGLELAIRLLEGYQSFTKEDYLYVSNLSQRIAPQEGKGLLLLGALEKLPDLIIEVQKFVNGTQQPQAALPADTSKAAGQTANAAQPGPMLNALAIQGFNPAQAAPPPAPQPAPPPIPQPGPVPAPQPKITNLFLALLSSADVQALLPTNINGALVVSQTSDLLDGRTPKPPLTDSDVTNLVTSWNIAIDFFAQQQFPANPNNPHPDLASIAGLVEIHAQLEVLYEQLTTIFEETGVISLLSLY